MIETKNETPEEKAARDVVAVRFAAAVAMVEAAGRLGLLVVAGVQEPGAGLSRMFSLLEKAVAELEPLMEAKAQADEEPLPEGTS
jgi:hypothetical protein